MVRRHSPIVGLVGLAVLALLIGACTRSASTPPPGSAEPDLPSEPMSAQQATMEAVRSALLTQTAQAGTGLQETPVTAVAPATAMPTQTTAPAASEEPSGPAYTTYIVQGGDWIYSIALKFEVEPEAIIALNNLTAPYAVEPGDVLKIPTSEEPTSATDTPASGGTKYTVKPGEWVYSIARKFGVDPYDIIRVNGLRYPYTIHPGQILTIP